MDQRRPRSHPHRTAWAGRPRIVGCRRPRVRDARASRCSAGSWIRPATPSTTRSSAAWRATGTRRPGDMIVRAVVGWGGKGVRGDTERAGSAGRRASTRASSPASTPSVSATRAPGARAPARRPGLRALRLRVGARPRLLLPEVRHADAARLIDAHLRLRLHAVRRRHRGDARHPRRRTHHLRVCGGALKKAMSTPRFYRGTGWARGTLDGRPHRECQETAIRRRPLPMAARTRPPARTLRSGSDGSSDKTVRAQGRFERQGPFGGENPPPARPMPRRALTSRARRRPPEPTRAARRVRLSRSPRPPPLHGGEPWDQQHARALGTHRGSSRASCPGTGYVRRAQVRGLLQPRSRGVRSRGAATGALEGDGRRRDRP